MKITRFTFLIILTAFLFICGDAQEVLQKTSFKSLKLSLRIKEKELCVGKPFTILASLENVGETEQIIDKKSVWRSFDVMGPIEESLFDKNIPETGSSSKILKFPRWNITTSLPLSQKKDSITLKPKEFYEDGKIIEANDEYFNLPGIYLFQSEYQQISEHPSKDTLIFGDTIRSNELLFTLKECKETN